MIGDRPAMTARRRALVGTSRPQIIPGGSRDTRPNYHPPNFEARRPKLLKSIDSDVLALLGVAPRTAFEVAEALAIETPTARHSLEHLTRHGYAVAITWSPTTWTAL